MNVPPGKERTIGLRINVDPVSDSAVLAFGGETTVSLKVGQQTKALMSIAPVETKLVIPDTLNNRLVQINDVTGIGWDTYPGISAYDVDFDAKGRIYFTDNGSGLQRIDDFKDDAPDTIDGDETIYAVTMDRNNDYVYDITSFGGIISKIDCKGVEPPVTYNLKAEPLIADDGNYGFYGIDIDDEGFLYVINSPVNVLYKYNPSLGVGDRVAGTYTNIILSNPRDVIVKDNYVYILNFDGESGNKIIKLTKGLTFVGSYGDKAEEPYPDNITGHFYGPLRFLAVTNSVFTIIDDRSTIGIAGSTDRLMQIDPGFNASSWRTYGSYGNGDGQFDFWLPQ
ncbi:MAG: hypothetical protein JW822_09675 [Spirochaetales bacterium]|nr:hypothetical protein [Spirochaetales bacterium]